MTPYSGPIVGCHYCAYEVPGNSQIQDISCATLAIEAKDGQIRAVCNLHAQLGRWRPRARRVGAVA